VRQLKEQAEDAKRHATLAAEKKSEAEKEKQRLVEEVKQAGREKQQLEQERQKMVDEAKQAEKDKHQLEKELSGLPAPDELKAKVGRASPQYPIHQPGTLARQPGGAGQCAPAVAPQSSSKHSPVPGGRPVTGSLVGVAG